VFITIGTFIEFLPQFGYTIYWSKHFASENRISLGILFQFLIDLEENECFFMFDLALGRLIFASVLDLVLPECFEEVRFNIVLTFYRYLKSVFPTVEEYLLLDVLSNSDNNVQKAADRLVKMGYVKRDTPSKNLAKIAGAQTLVT
jgi:hypothetical protein